MKVIAFAASTSSTSINKQLVVAASSLLEQENSAVEVETIDLRDFPMPLYSADEERENGVPEVASRLLDAISAADCLVISFAEHNGSYTAAYKNAFDWMSRISKKVYDGKRIVALSTSPGPGGAANVLKTFETSAPHFGAEVIGTLSVPSFQQSFIADEGKLAAEWEHRVRELVSGL